MSFMDYTRSRFYSAVLGLVWLQHGLQLPVRAFLIVGLQALQTFGLRIAGTRAALSLAARQQQRGFGVGGIVIERRLKTFGGLSEAARAPQRVAQIELVHRIAAVAFQSFAKVVQG